MRRRGGPVLGPVRVWIDIPSETDIDWEVKFGKKVAIISWI